MVTIEEKEHLENPLNTAAVHGEISWNPGWFTGTPVVPVEWVFWNIHPKKKSHQSSCIKLQKQGSYFFLEIIIKMVDFLWLCYFTRVCQQCDSATLKQLHRSKIYSVAPSNTTSSNKVNHSQTQPHLAPHKWWHQDINEPAGIRPTNLNSEVPKNQRFAKNCPFQIGFFWKDKLSHVFFLQGAKYKIAKKHWSHQFSTQTNPLFLVFGPLNLKLFTFFQLVLGCIVVEFDLLFNLLEDVVPQILRDFLETCL